VNAPKVVSMCQDKTCNVYLPMRICSDGVFLFLLDFLFARTSFAIRGIRLGGVVRSAQSGLRARARAVARLPAYVRACVTPCDSELNSGEDIKDHT
jgi:hypothetical protein